MTLDYFYGEQADQFTFYRIPKALFTEERFKSISAEAKILYGILLDRMSLSRRKLLQDLQSRNERMFLLTFLVLNVADTKQQLDNNVFQASSIAQKYNCQLTCLDFRQEEGLMSSLPLGFNQVEIQRGMTTSSVAIFVPFTTQELFQNGSGALYCGINALSNNLIMVDRKLLKNPNGLILGTPGSGKSFAAKREIANVFFVTDDDIIVCDPESEFVLLTVIIWIATKIVELSAVVLNFIAIATALGAICIIIDGRTASGIAGLVAAFFLTPFGLPLFAMLLLEGVKSIKCRIQECVYG